MKPTLAVCLAASLALLTDGHAHAEEEREDSFFLLLQHWAPEVELASHGRELVVGDRLDSLDPHIARSVALLVQLADDLAAAASYDAENAKAIRGQVIAEAFALQRLLRTATLPAVTLWEPPIIILNTGQTHDSYDENVLLLLDFWGDDTYLNNAGGSNLLGGCEVAAGGGAAILLDFSGNDTYAATSCGALGGGFLGVGLLLDFEGNDRYTGGDGGVLGGGYDGHGALLDLAGNDVYRGGSWGVNGGAASTQLAAASGLLLDGAGDDTYIGNSYGVNGGALLGKGMLIDLGGNDLYVAEGGGTNGGAATGRGMLVDGSGNDTYLATSAGTNGGATGPGSVGALLDLDGDDSFVAGGNGANGAASLGNGRLVDLRGNDTYEGQGLANGAANLGQGLLFDGQGYDYYSTPPWPSAYDQSIIGFGIVGLQLDAGSSQVCLGLALPQCITLLLGDGLKLPRPRSL